MDYATIKSDSFLTKGQLPLVVPGLHSEGVEINLIHALGGNRSNSRQSSSGALKSKGETLDNGNNTKAMVIRELNEYFYEADLSRIEASRNAFGLASKMDDGMSPHS